MGIVWVLVGAVVLAAVGGGIAAVFHSLRRAAAADARERELRTEHLAEEIQVKRAVQRELADARLRARALEANPGWDTAAFDHAVSAWRAEVLVRRDLPLRFGHLSGIVLPDQIEHVLPGCGHGSPGTAR